MLPDDIRAYPIIVDLILIRCPTAIPFIVAAGRHALAMGRGHPWDVTEWIFENRLEHDPRVRDMFTRTSLDAVEFVILRDKGALID